MTNIKVPKWAQNKLLDSEKVIARLDLFYATDRRLLRFQGLLDLASLDFNFGVDAFEKQPKISQYDIYLNNGNSHYNLYY